MGIFSNYKNKVGKKLDNFKAAQEEKRIRQDYEAQADREYKQRSYSAESVDTARNFAKEKAYETMSANVPLHQKVKAINEFYKDDSKPKLSRGMQELSDHAYINRYRRHQRMEKLSAIQQAVKEDKLRKMNESMIRKMQVQERSAMQKSQRAADSLIRQAKINIRKK